MVKSGEDLWVDTNDKKPLMANYQEQFWSQVGFTSHINLFSIIYYSLNCLSPPTKVDEEDADGDWNTDDSEPPAKKRDLVKSVSVENFVRPVRKELPKDFDPGQAFPDTLYFKDAELGNNVMHKMKPTDKANIKKMCRHYRCAHYRSYKCDAKLCVEISGELIISYCGVLYLFNN